VQPTKTKNTYLCQTPSACVHVHAMVLVRVEGENSGMVARGARRGRGFALVVGGDCTNQALPGAWRGTGQPRFAVTANGRDFGSYRSIYVCEICECDLFRFHDYISKCERPYKYKYKNILYILIEIEIVLLYLYYY